jgi:hypothetical protein
LRSGELAGGVIHEGGDVSAQSLSMPRDVRVIYLGAPPPIDRREDGEVFVHIRADLERLPHLWTQAIRVELQSRGLTEDQIEERVTSPALRALSDVLAVALELDLVSQTRAYDALSYGALMDGSLASCVESLELYLYPLLNDPARGQRHVERDCLAAFINRDEERYAICWRSLFSEEPTRSISEINLSSSSDRG